MSQFSSMTVVQLKEALKEKGLSADGKKADLVARLTEASAGELGAELDEEDAPADPPAQQPPAEQPAEAPAEAPAPEAAAETPAEKEDKKPKVLSAEERKQLAVELLTKKIKRAEKFGDEASAAAAKKDLARVEKFGVDAGTALAKEIGVLDRSVNSELSTRKSKKNKGKVQK